MKPRFRVGQRVVITHLEGTIVTIEGIEKDIFIVEVGHVLPRQVFCYAEQMRRVGPRPAPKRRKKRK